MKFLLLQVLISKNYRGDIDMGKIDNFMPLIMEREEEGNMTPILTHGNTTFVYIKYNNLYRILALVANLFYYSLIINALNCKLIW